MLILAIMTSVSIVCVCGNDIMCSVDRVVNSVMNRR